MFLAMHSWVRFPSRTHLFFHTASKISQRGHQRSETIVPPVSRTRPTSGVNSLLSNIEILPVPAAKPAKPPPPKGADKKPLDKPDGPVSMEEAVPPEENKGSGPDDPQVPAELDEKLEGESPKETAEPTEPPPQDAEAQEPRKETDEAGEEGTPAPAKEEEGDKKVKPLNQMNAAEAALNAGLIDKRDPLGIKEKPVLLMESG